MSSQPAADPASPTFAAVLFDLDGTLIDSTPAVVRSWVAWAVEYGIDPLALQGFHGVPARSIVARFVSADQVPDALARVTELEVGDVSDIVLLPGAAAALAALAAVPNAIATSCTRELADARLAASGLVRPDVVVTADDVEHGKPAPDPFLLAARRLGVDPADCLVVEDAPSGLTAARAAGCATLAVTTTSAAADLTADHVVPDLSQVRFSVVDGRVRLEVLAQAVAD
ncbi:HAD-IA family hydrolase [Microlunatus sp. Y2014]|uniref:HAD-IA family hydrolase n=1 Tax=Microlunatus sp. Y2014 TaxID=3418488 RepID=UPI003DA74AE7